MLPPSPEALRWRERRNTLMVGSVIFGLGLWLGWLLRKADCLATAAEAVIESAAAYRLAQCVALTAELRPSLCD